MPAALFPGNLQYLSICKFPERKSVLFRSERLFLNGGRMETREKYGRLTPVRKLEGYGGRNVWECRCDCGNLCHVRMSNLKSGHTKSCGCLRKEKQKKKFHDLTGMRFGKLTVINFVSQKSGGPSLWNCRCDCGNMTQQYGPNLRRGLVVSCGCVRRESGKKQYEQNIHYINGTQLELVRSKKIWKTNKTGVKGVYQEKRTGKYIASMTFQGKREILGRFQTLEEARQAREQAEEERDRKIQWMLLGAEK